MSFLRLIARSLVYHRRMHAGLLIGVTLACAILSGALIVGDSVAYSLREIAAQRLGRVAYALSWTNRLFAQDLAAHVHEQDARINPASVLLLNGMASVPAGQGGSRNQLNRVQVAGVDSDFWRFAREAPTLVLGPQEAAINEKTAAALGVKAGDDVSLRVVKYGQMPLDAPLSSRKETHVASSLVTVKAVLPDAQMGAFSLAANQTTPYNVFVERGWLQEQTELPGLADLMLADDASSAEDVQGALDRAWTLEDAGLHLRLHASGVVQLESTRVFLDEEVVRAALQVPGARATLTYLVNSIAKGGRATPYSFVEAGPVPQDMRDEEVVVNQWLSEQIGAVAGDALDVAYYELTPSNTFVERHRTLVVRGVIPMSELAVERELAPRFPGLSDVESCREWDIGMPMDAANLRDPANEAYWKEYGQTPKLLTTLKAGQEMWSNRFGDVTAVRFPAGSSEAEIRRLVREQVPANKIGLRFTPVAQIARDAVAQAMDFGGLFVGMSAFLIVAALILLGLLYVFGIQQRASEMGVLSATGFPRSKIRALFLIEACPTAFLGALLGAVAGTAYARVLLAMLTRYWPGAVAGTAIHFYIEATTLLLGTCAALLCAFAVVSTAIWRGTRRSARELLTTDFSSAMTTVGGRPVSRKKSVVVLVVSSAFVLLAVGTALHVWLSKPPDLVEPFFTVGTFLLLAGLGYYAWYLTHLAMRPAYRQLKLWKMALANLARRRGRSLSVAGLTACGCFLVFSVSSMQENVALHADARDSGTGGFQLFAETTAPIVVAPGDLAKTLGVDAVPLRVRDGDDAGCLNLNRAQTPKLYGVDAAALSRLGAFGTTEDGESVWSLLDEKLPDGLVPALVGDTNTAMWGLQKKTGVANGDVLTYRDESGVEVKLKLVGQLPMRLSVFQGAILISDDAFTRLFPSEAGFRAFLIDTPADTIAETGARLNRDFEKVGIEAVLTVQRLREFYAVESTYLAMFLVLGGLGLVLGAGGVGIVVLRNVFERRGEVALLHALGYERGTVFRVFFIEHAMLVTTGMALGVLASAASIVPLVLFSQTHVSIGLQAVLLALIAGANFAGVILALVIGLPRNPIGDLREE